MINYRPYFHYNEDMERALIGICLLERLSFSSLVGIIDKKEVFYYSGHQTVFQVMMDMYKLSLPIDLLTVTQYCYEVKKMDRIGDSFTVNYLVRCTREVVSSASLEYWAAIIMEQYRRRRVMEIKFSAIDDDGFDPTQNIRAINEDLNKLMDSKFQKDWVGMDELIIQLYKHQDEMKQNQGIGLLTGFPTLDNANGGLFPGNMVFVGARPSVGKSAWANSVALAAAEKGSKVGIISLEMSNVEIAARMAAIDTNTDYSVIYRGLMRDEYETQRMYQRLNDKTVMLPIYVSDKTDVNSFDIRRKAERLKSKEGLDLLIIDYLQLIGTSDAKNTNRENEVAKISRGIKILAKDLKIPVIVLGQLNREVTKRKGKDRYPILGDIRESGAIEQDADIVMFLHSDYLSGYTEREDTEETTEGEADLVIRKWRNGVNNFVVPLNFEGRKMKFTERSGGFQANIPATHINTEAPF